MLCTCSLRSQYHIKCVYLHVESVESALQIQVEGGGKPEKGESNPLLLLSLEGARRYKCLHTL